MQGSSIPPPEGSRVTRFGSAVFAGTAASLLASIPAALRIAPAADADLGVSGVWLGLAGAALVPMVALVPVLRGARRGFGSVLWTLASLDALRVWGALLRKTTHHHALAGTTFALVGLAILVVLAV